jgi:hypothetical protein
MHLWPPSESTDSYSLHRLLADAQQFLDDARR